MTIHHSKLNCREKTELSGEAGKEKEEDCIEVWSAWEQGTSRRVGLPNFTTYE